MTETKGKSKSDPEIAGRLAEIRLIREVHDLFPMPRIEGVALEVIERLDALKASMTEEQLDQEGSSEDVLLGVYNNDLFVKRQVAPLVEDLFERTSQTLFITEGTSLGYSFTQSEAKGESAIYEVSLVIDDASQNFTTIDSSQEIQEIWDASGPQIRLGMKVFAQYSKREVIDRFYEHVREYANP